MGVLVLQIFRNKTQRKPESLITMSWLFAERQNTYMKRLKHRKVRTVFPALFLTTAILLGSFSGCEIKDVPLTEKDENTENEIFAMEYPETEADVSEPESEPEPQSGLHMIQYAKKDFLKPYGDGWILSALSFGPTALRSGPDGMFTAVGFDPNSNKVYLAVADPLALTAAEGIVEIGATPEYGSRDIDAVLLGDMFLVQDMQDGFLYSVRSDFSVADQVEMEDAYAGRMIVLTDGSVLFSHGTFGNLRFAHIVEDGEIVLETKAVALPEPYNEIYVNGITEEGILLATLDNGADWENIVGEYLQIYALLNLETGTVSPIPIDITVGLAVVGSEIAEYQYGNHNFKLYLPGTDDGFIWLRGPEDAYLANSFCLPSELMYFEWSSESEIIWTAVDPVSTRTVGRTVFQKEDVDFYGNEVVETGEYAVCRIGHFGSDSLVYLWKNRSAPELAGYPMLENSLSSRIGSEINRIYEETGISIYIGNDAVRFLEGYAIQVVEDEEAILNGLEKICMFFDNCPPGFIKELVEWNSSIDICLSGKIIPQIGNRDSISDASAFVQETDGVQVMVVDILQSGLTETVAHEFLHIAENTMWEMADQEGYSGELMPFEHWELLNPDGFSYHWAYTDENGNTNSSEDPHVFTARAEDGDINDIYFLDGYCTTFPKEDRARIFQYLAVYSPEELPEAFQSEALKRKGAYLCICLRKYFDSVSQAEDVFWEQDMDLNTYTWEYFVENYDYEAWLNAHTYG